MRIFIKLTLFPLMLFFISCGTSLKLSPQEMLEASGREKMPTAEEFPDDGAVILYESFKDKLYLDSEWDVNVEFTVHRAILYFNDKAEDWLSNSIFLDPDRTLINFSARTIKPNGEILELTENDLHPTQLKEDYVEFSDDKSLKFTFPGVEPGAILEYSYKVNRSGFYWGDKWYVQSSIPKLYTKFSMEIPSIFFRYKNNWTYSANNFELGKPIVRKNIINQQSRKDRSQSFYWELLDIPALKSEPNRPPYREIANYVTFDLKYKDWNDLTEKYWKMIKKYFNPTDMSYEGMAKKIIGDAKNDYTKIKKVFDYTQQKYRYLAVHIGESGYIPHTVKSIIKNKYGDCKDMTVLNVVLLKALGFKVYPALVNTRGKGDNPGNLITLDFNHMIALVVDSGGKEYWLDATGSSCPLGEAYPSIENANALVIYEDGKSKHKRIPLSKYKNNCTERRVSYEILKDGSIKGKANLSFKGNDNLSIRSNLKDASRNDMKKILERLINANTPDLTIDSLVYDDPSTIEKTFNITIFFSKDQIGSKAGDLFIFKPNIFVLEPELDRFRDEKREYAVRYYAPFSMIDDVEIKFDESLFKIKSLGKVIRTNFPFASISMIGRKKAPGKICIRRDFNIKKMNISAGCYKDFRELHKSIAAANNENIVLEYKR